MYGYPNAANPGGVNDPLISAEASRCVRPPARLDLTYNMR